MLEQNIDVQKLQEKGFAINQINQIIKTYDKTQYNLEYVDVNIDCDFIRMFRHSIINNEFSKNQLLVIKDGIKNKLDISLYFFAKYSFDKMLLINKALKNNIYIKPYLSVYKENEDLPTLRLIYDGIEQNLDISKYCDKIYNYEQKVQIKRGLEANVDVDLYSNPKNNADKMAIYFKMLRDGMDITPYLNENYSYIDLEKIRKTKLAKVQAE